MEKNKLTMYPKYYTCHHLFYKVESPTRYVCVSLYRQSLGVRVVNVDTFDTELMDESTAHEFNHAAAQAIQLLNEKLFD